MANIKEAFEYASQNPESDFAKNLSQLAASGSLDVEARRNNIDLTPFKPKPIEQKAPLGVRAANTAASIVGVKNIGQGLGQALTMGKNAKGMEEAQQQGIDLQTQLLQRIKEKKARGEDTSRLDIALQDLGGNIQDIGTQTEKVLNPNEITKGQVAGDLLQIGSFMFPYGKVAGVASKVLGRTGGAIASGATGGYLADIGFNLQDKKTGADVLKPGFGVALGVAAPLVGGAIRAARNARPVASEVENTLGRILQGKTDDIAPAQKALSAIDTTGVKTRGELSEKLAEGIRRNSELVDQELLKDTGSYTLKDLAIKQVDNAGNEIATDYVGEALKNLDEMYGAIGDDVSKSNINLLAEKAATEGLTRKEVNDIARMYQEEFGSKAFGKTGDALTSVNAQKYENVRSGLKETARAGLGGDEAKALDSVTSAMYNTKRLIDRGVEGVNALKQRVVDRGIMEKLGRKAVNMVNAITGGFLKSAVGAALPSNVGLKTLNWLDLEKKLGNDLKLIQKANGVTSDSALIKLLNTAAEKFKFPGDEAVDVIQNL